MTNLLNTKKYMVASQFVLQSGALRVAAAESMYKLVKGVEPMTSTDTTDLFFQPGFIPYRAGAVQCRGSASSIASLSPPRSLSRPRPSMQLTVALLVTIRRVRRRAPRWRRSRRSCAA